MDRWRRAEISAARSFIATAIFLLAFSTIAHCQAPTEGVLLGIVQNTLPQTAKNPPDTLTLEDLETGAIRSTRIDPDGSFILAGLSPADYRLSIDGLSATRPIRIIAGALLQLRINLDATTLVVRILDPVLDLTQPPSQSPTSTSAQPLAEPLLPPAGIEPDLNDDGLVSLHGLAASQGAAAFDGVNADQAQGAVPAGTGRDTGFDDDSGDEAELSTGPSHGLARGRHAGAAYTYATASIRQTTLNPQGYSAQAGQAGANLNVITRQGGEKLHGTVAFQLQSSALAAKDPLAIATTYLDGVVTSAEVKPHDLRLNASIALGGPFWFGSPRVRAVHFFYAFDAQRRGFPAVASPANPSFYLLTPEQVDLLANRGVASGPTRRALNFLSAETGIVPRRSDQTINFGRLDWLARPHLGLGAEYNRVRWNSPAGLINAPVVARGRASLGNANGSLDQLLLRLSPRFGARLSLELRAALTQDLQYETPQSPLPQEAAIGPAGLSPEVSIGPDGLLFGTPANLSHLAYPQEQRGELTAVVTFTHPRNLLQLGGSAASINERVATLANPAGTFRYDSGTTRGHDGGLVDFISDFSFSAQSPRSGACPAAAAAVHNFCFRSFTQSFGRQQVQFATQEWAGFVEDTWHPRPGLLLHAGLRYEYQFLPLPQQPNSTLDQLFSARGASSVFPEDRNNLGPRLALSFSPFGEKNLLIKLGYGAFFGRVPGATLQAALTDTAEPTSTTRIRITPTTITACPQTANEGFGYLCSFIEPPTGITAATTSAIVFDRHFRLPVVQQASLYLQQQILSRTTLELGFVFNADLQLPGSTDLNIAPSTGTGLFQLQGGTHTQGVQDGETFVVPVYRTRISPAFGPVTSIVSNGNAYYDALIVKLQTRPARRLLIAANYTWSRAIDFGQSSSATPSTNSQFDPFADGYDRGLASLNYPQALHLAGAWSPLPERSIQGHSRWQNGWTLTGLSTARSGRPYSYNISGGPFLPGGHESINGSGGALYLPTVGRNTLRLPPTLKTDLRLTRSFKAWPGARAAASVEALNVFNHQSISSVSERAFLAGAPVAGVTPLVFQGAAQVAAEGLNTRPFGTPTSTGSMLSRERQIHFSLRISF